MTYIELSDYARGHLELAADSAFFNVDSGVWCIELYLAVVPEGATELAADVACECGPYVQVLTTADGREVYVYRMTPEDREPFGDRLMNFMVHTPRQSS